MDQELQRIQRANEVRLAWRTSGQPADARCCICSIQRRADVMAAIVKVNVLSTRSSATALKQRASIEWLAAIHRRVTLNNASDYRTNGHYRTPNLNPSPLVRWPDSPMHC